MSPEFPTHLKVKVCGLRHTPNLVEISQLSIDLMGFIFYPESPRYAKDTLEKEALEALPSSIGKVGVFVNEHPDTLLEIVHAYHFDLVQLHGKENPAHCESIKKAGVQVLKVFSVAEEKDLRYTKEFEEVADYFLFDTKSPSHGGTGQKFNWDLLDAYNGAKPVFLSGGIGPEDALSIQSAVKKYPWIVGVDLNSRFELAPGLKDAHVLNTFIASLNR